jgi:hypothetical protein
MTDRNDQPEAEPAPKRGAAAYKAEREGIDKRNEQASKRGRQERDAVDRAAMERQRALERRNDAGLYAS